MCWTQLKKFGPLSPGVLCWLRACVCALVIWCCEQGYGAGVLRSRRFLGGFGVGFLTTLGVGVGFFCPTPDVQLDNFLHHTPKLGIPLEMVQFLLKLLLKQISSCASRFPLILTTKFHSLYVKESEILESWCRSRIFYLRLRNPGCEM